MSDGTVVFMAKTV